MGRGGRAIGLLLAAGLTLPAQAPAPPAPVDPRASVVLVRASEGRGQEGALQRVRQGSGVVMAPGLVVTNAHVVAGGGVITVKQGGAGWQARVRAFDPGRDLALLSVPGLPCPAAKAADPARRAPGMAIQAIGYPGQLLRLSRGHLTGVWHSMGGLLLQSDAATDTGSSGGGLFDEAGRLLGLTTMVFEKTPGISFSLAVENLDSLLDLPPPGETLTPPKDLVPELVRSIAAHPENHPAWEAFTLDWVKLSPRDPEAWYARGCALHLRLLGESADHPGVAFPEALWRETAAAFRKAAELAPDLAPAWNNLGTLLELNNKFPEAEAALRRALALAPDYALAWVNLARTQANAGRYREATAAYRTALAYRPLDGALWWGLGLAETQDGAAPAGLEHLARAATLLPRQADLWADLARLRLRAGDQEGSEVAVARLRELNPARADQVARDLRRR